MNDLTDDQLMALARPACGNFRWPSTPLDIMRAAIAADRAQRGEPVRYWALIDPVERLIKMDSSDGSLMFFGSQKEAELAANRNGNCTVHPVVYYTAPPAAPVVPEGWLRAVDEAMVCVHLGVANADDSYDVARSKLKELIVWHCDVATDPCVNGGWKLVPVQPTEEMLESARLATESEGLTTTTWLRDCVYRAMLATTPEPKP